MSRGPSRSRRSVSDRGGLRHRHRHRTGVPPEDLPGLRAGRRLVHAAVRGPGPGPGDQPVGGRGPRRAPDGRQRRQGPRGDLHARAADCARPDSGAGRSAAEARRPAAATAAEDPAGRGRRRPPAGLDPTPGPAPLYGQGADSLASALAIAAAEDFDLVISDIGLPDGSGLDLMRELRTADRVPGIALSGFGTDEDIRREQGGRVPRPPDQARQLPGPGGDDSAGDLGGRPSSRPCA